MSVVVDPIAGVRYVPEDFEPNSGWLIGSDNDWVAKIQWNGDPLEAKQTATGFAMAQAPEMLAELRDVLPRNVCLTNPNVPDSAVVALECTMGDLRRIWALVDAATHEVEEREVG